MSTTPETPDELADPSVQRVAEVYAKAFLAAAGDRAAGAVEELTAIDGEVLKRFPKLVELFGSGFVSNEDKVKIVDRTFGGRVAPIVLNFLRVLAAHDRLNVLRDVVRVVREQFEVLQGFVRVEVGTAAPLTDDMTAKIKQQLRGMLGGEPVIVSKINPDLIGGIVLRVGDAVYDGSVAAQLSGMRSRIINRSVHEIQSRRDRFRHPAGN